MEKKSKRIVFATLLGFSFWAESLSLGQDIPTKPQRTGIAVEDLGPESRKELEQSIAGWIQKLGDESYAVRQQAASELERMGLLAFEQLRKAMLDPDPQISSSAQYIIQSVHQTWAWDTDPIEVKNLLQTYHLCSPADRIARIDRLSILATDASVAALCRLTRYETNDAISKHAAIVMIKSAIPADATQKVSRIRTIRQVLGGSQRQSCQWLIHYVDLISTDQFDSDWWIKEAREEHKNFINTPKVSNVSNVVDLYQWVCKRLIQDNKSKLAIELAEGMLELLPSTGHQLAGTCEWAIDTGIPEWVEKVEARFPTLFRNFARLDYCLAESYGIRGMDDEAEKVARRAYLRGAKGDEIPVRFMERYDIAKELRNRGRFDWAQREFSASLVNADPLNLATVTAYLDYSSMLQDLGKYSEAANLWKNFAERLQTEPLYAKQINAVYREFDNGDADEEGASGVFIERYYFLCGMNAKQENDSENAILFFEKGLTFSKRNSDAWIELYQLSDDKENVREQSQWLKSELRRTIGKLDQSLVSGSLENDARIKSQLAISLNELAWLLSNTGDNLEEATKVAERACLMDGVSASFLDTLACVQFQRGMLDEAIATQQRAVDLEPHGQQLQRVLEKYKKAKG